ncbi:hypothetical protein Glove_350g20 [Diversispora epigaea]|uniref:Uncharacterized protein n=1 Tax=Diversispora epigaea TaxID=1348612 RepID=A0A397HDU6_9GLOM|nr:hypothetical protein Glove_350g20 [Diversispora epigaea]
MSMNNLSTTGIPIWNSFVCSQNLSSITIETLRRGRTFGNGTETTDKATLLPESYISKTDTKSLTSGDWTLTTGTWPCFYFNNSNKDYKFIPGVVDQLIIVALVEGNQTQQDTGLLFGVFDDIRPLNVVEPFNAGIPSINTYTFSLTERVDVNNKEYLYFTVNTQNYHPIAAFGNPSIAARFLYSPDTYLSIKYVEKLEYTIYDIIAASGGNLTYAIALWIILFGRGKYKSWGLVQRYILRNSPDVNKKDDSNRLVNIPFYSNKNVISFGGDEKDKKNNSNDKNNDYNGRNYNNNNTNNNNDKNNGKNKDNDLENQDNQTPYNQQPHYYSERSSATSPFYFSTTGSPTDYPKSATTPTFGNIDDRSNIGVGGGSGMIHGGGGRGLNELTDKEITKKINKIVDEKLWFLEQTISRHYLSGFRLRRYNSDLRKLKQKSGHGDDDDEYNVNDDEEVKPSSRRFSSPSHNSYPVVQLKEIDLKKKRKQGKQSESNSENLEDNPDLTLN